MQTLPWHEIIWQEISAGANIKETYYLNTWTVVVISNCTQGKASCVKEADCIFIGVVTKSSNTKL